MTKSKKKEKLSQAFLKIAEWVAPKKTGEYILHNFLKPRRFKRPEWEKALIAKATKEILPSGRTIWTWGSTGPRVFLVHGWEGRGSQLGAFVESLSSVGYQIIAWDGPAHGDSPGESTHLLEFSQALKHDLNHMGSLDAVIAHSMGAAALMLAIEEGLIINKAVLIASPSQWEPAIRSTGEKLKLKASTIQAVIESLEKRVGHSLNYFDVQSWKTPANPLLLLHDENDKDIPPSEFLRLQEAYPHAKRKLFKGLGHRRILRDAQVIEEVVQFLNEVA